MLVLLDPVSRYGEMLEGSRKVELLPLVSAETPLSEVS